MELALCGVLVPLTPESSIEPWSPVRCRSCDVYASLESESFSLMRA